MGWNWAITFCFLFTLSLVSAAIPADCDSSIEAYWKFDSNTKDSVGSFDGGSFSNFAPFKVGDSADFSGSNSISINDRGGTDIDLKDSSTLQFWFYGGSDMDGGTFIEKDGAYFVKLVPSGPMIKVEATFGDYTVSSIVLDRGLDYMVTVVHNLTHLRLYINGVLNDTVKAGTYPSSTSSDVVFGKDFTGRIDEAVIYDRVLEEYEIRADYDLTSSGKDYCHSVGAKKTSSTRTNFSINGCYFESGNFGLTAGSCSRNGRYYCHAQDEGYDTIADFGGCNRAGDLNPNNPSDVPDLCCPAGYYCDDEDAAGNALSDFKCVQSTVQCSVLDKADCEAESRCLWVVDEDDGFCTGHLADYSCSFYKSKNSCEEDLYNLGSTGVGTDKCGAYIYDDSSLVSYLVPVDSCKCVWSANKCELSYEVVPDIHDGNPASFTCKKDFKTGDCVEGFQNLVWNVTPQGTTAFNLLSESTRNSLLSNSGCVDGVDERSCGDPLVKLPFFSLVSLVLVIFILGVYYFFRD